MALATVFLDVGGVLLFPNWVRISEVLATHGVTVSPEALARAEHPAKRQLDVGETIGATTDASRAWLYFDLILTAAGVPLSNATHDALEELHAYHRARNLWEYVPPDVIPALEALRARGLPVTLVSNANGTLRHHLDRLGLTHWCQLVLDSHDLGVEKPDPRIFEIALAQSGADRATTIHVGDIYHVDVVGARAAGIRPVLLDEAGLYADADCRRVRSLSELVSAIENGEF